MSETEGVAKVKLHKQVPAGFVSKGEERETLPEKKEDSEELSSEDFSKAADQAQARELSSIRPQQNARSCRELMLLCAGNAEQRGPERAARSGKPSRKHCWRIGAQRDREAARP